jgi:hypothetical protein
MKRTLIARRPLKGRFAAEELGDGAGELVLDVRARPLGER